MHLIFFHPCSLIRFFLFLGLLGGLSICPFSIFSCIPSPSPFLFLLSFSLLTALPAFTNPQPHPIQFLGTEVSLALRKHFCTRSTQLITPLARYLNTLIPSPEEVHGHRAAVAGHARTETLTPRQSQKGTGTQKQPQAQAQTWSVGSGLRYLASTASLPAQTQKQVPSPANSTGSSPVPSFRSVNAVSMSSTSTSTPGSNKPGTSTATATTTTPSNGSASSKPKDKPLLRLKPFNSAAFLASLKTYSVGGGGIAGSGNGGAGVGSLLPFKSASKRVEFYER